MKKDILKHKYLITIILIIHCCEGGVQDSVREFVEEPRAVGAQETFVIVDDGTIGLMVVLLSSTFSISVSERGQQKNRTVNWLQNPRTWVLLTTRVINFKYYFILL